jgi:CHAT domain-containing protein/tetratricopeptide (TPR) repeat protein
MASASPVASREPLIDRLAEFSQARLRTTFLLQHRELWDAAVVEDLYARIVRVARVDLQRADRLARAARWIADKLDDAGSRAQSLRASGHIRFFQGKYTAALEEYEAAARLFRQAGREVDRARTLNGALQSLISLGRYDEALTSAAEARTLFEQHGAAVNLARLDSNVANINARQDRFEDALALYRRAHEQLAAIGEPQDVAAVLSNIALCQINLGDFTSALGTYHAAREYCDRHDMPLLVTQADYNIAYLHYLRGEYTRALDLYRMAREHSQRVGDAYHSALCDLDCSEMYLELNLCDDAAELAERARVQFGALRMAYEQAKAVTNLAIAASRRGDPTRAGRLFGRARQLFGREGNMAWLALVDLYEALVLHRDGQYLKARALAEHARDLFAQAAVPARAALCDLLLARLELQDGNTQAADDLCRAVVEKAVDAQTPILTYQANFMLGLAREAGGDHESALKAFETAHAALENLRTQLRGDDLKLAFLEDKQAVYESLVSSCLASRSSDRLHAAFGYIEGGKSRSLADLIAVRAASLAPRGAENNTAAPLLRQELSWHYRQIALEETRPDRRSAERMEALRERTRDLENQLGRSLDEARRTDQEFSALQTGTSFNLDEIRSTLAPGTLMLEYYQARGQTYVCVLGREQLEIVPLGPIADLRRLVRLLQFQLSRFRIGPEYLNMFGAHLQTSTDAHLRELHALLIAPVRERLHAEHLVVVPHDVLHYVPFHALLDGSRPLIDDFTVSYAPSASVYRLCRTKRASVREGAVIMGVPDAGTPFIHDEVRAVAEAMPASQVFVGADATAQALQTRGEHSRFIHVATHGFFRRDNPMFSSIRLGDGPLSVYDLYQFHLSAELVALSGCGTGLSVVVGGDEQLGLVRGLLYAGAHAVLLTLWDAYDGSTAEFMAMFYQQITKGRTKARAAQEAMRQLRQMRPHPFYWAPFVLIGDAEARFGVAGG